MALPSIPNPAPKLRTGTALGARVNAGFCATWNWLVDVLRNAEKYFVSAVNGISDTVEIVGGDGISVSTSGNTITVSIGDSDDENENDKTDDGGGAGDQGGGDDGSGDDSGGGDDSGDDPGDEPGDEPGGGGGSGGGSGGGGTDCNSWSDTPANDTSENEAGNAGDNCNELNGW